jgi:thiaminase/transcriptional activator TenA
MSLTQELRGRHHGLWERVAAHPFVIEMGEGALPVEKFRRYFLQDYVFVNDLVKMTGLAIAKAPDMSSVAMLERFLGGVGDPEETLFKRAFRELGATEEEYSSASASPTTQAFADFLVRTSLEGSFEDILAVIYVVEGTYLDWGTRLLEAGKSPDNAFYREWIELHGPDVLGDLVGWVGRSLDGAKLGSKRARIEHLFLTTLRYEYMFFEAAYSGGPGWPDE